MNILIKNLIKIFYLIIFRKYPNYLIFFITSKCNSRCKTCFYWRKIDHVRPENELTIEEVKKISQRFNYLIQLTISGGEPFMRDDLDEIIYQFYLYSKLQFVTIPTNGYYTDNIVKTIKKILKKCPKLIVKLSLSIDGIGLKHDRIRGLNKNFDKLIQTYKQLKEIKNNNLNLILVANTVLSYYNKNCLEEIFKYTYNNFDLDEHSITLIRNDARDKQSLNVLASDYLNALDSLKNKFYKFKNKKKILINIFSILDDLIEQTIKKILKKNKMVFPCVACKQLITINEIGEVFPCEMLNVCRSRTNISNMVIGNLRENDYDIRKIIKSKKSHLIQKKIRDSKCYCTFECAITADIIFNPRTYLFLIKQIIKNYLSFLFKAEKTR